MLNFLPILLILITLFAILFLRRSRLTLGSVWLILVILSLLNWGALIFLRSHLPDPLVIKNWFPLAGQNDSLVLAITQNTWLLFFGLATLMTGILFASSAHLEDKHIFAIWVETLILSAVGMLVLLADSPLAFLLFWILADLSEIIIFAIINREQVLPIQTYSIFLGRALGLGLVMLAMVLAYQSQTPLDLSTAQGNILTLLIAGVGLRLGVLPLHLPYTQEFTQRRSIGTLLRFLAPLSAISFLTRLSVPQSITGVTLVLFIFSVFSCVVGSVNWLLAKNELEGRPYWLLAFSGFALISYFHGQSLSVLVWGFLMVTIGGWIFLSESKEHKFDFLLPFALLTLSGLPFTPASMGLLGIVGGTLREFNPFLWISLALLVIGLFRFSIKANDEKKTLESWMKGFYYIGMGILILSSWVMILFNFRGWNQLQTWWVGVIVTVILAPVLFLQIKPEMQKRLVNSRINKIYSLMARFGDMINRFFHFDWLYQIFGFLFSALKWVVVEFNTVLEGTGGILWVLVVLALLLSLLVKGMGA